MLPPCPDSFRSRSSWGCAVRVINIFSHRWHSRVCLTRSQMLREISQSDRDDALSRTCWHNPAVVASWHRRTEGTLLLREESVFRRRACRRASAQFEQDWPALAFTRSATVCSPDKFFLDSWVERPQPGATPGEFVLVLIDVLSRIGSAVKACVSEGRSAPPRPPTAYRYASRLPRRGTTASYSAPPPTPLTPPRATRSAGPP